jgi:hypothetical protein
MAKARKLGHDTRVSTTDETNPRTERQPSPAAAPNRATPLAAAFIAIGMLGSSAIVARAALHAIRVKTGDQTVSVTGSSRVRIRSDLAIWTCSVAVRAPEMTSANATLASQVPRVRAWIESQGTPASEIALDPVAVTETHPYNAQGEEQSDQVNGYRLSQTIVVTSHDVDRVARIASDVTTLLAQNIQVTSDAPQFLYTQLAQLKLRLLAEASRDARERAERIAQHAHAQIGGLSTARMGVIQVNAANETETSAEGVNDTGSIEKDALGVVHAVFYTQ